MYKYEDGSSGGSGSIGLYVVRNGGMGEGAKSINPGYNKREREGRGWDGMGWDGIVREREGKRENKVCKRVSQ
jgi:hypothetical protein